MVLPSEAGLEVGIINISIKYLICQYSLDIESSRSNAGLNIRQSHSSLKYGIIHLLNKKSAPPKFST